LKSRAQEKVDALAGVERWKAQHPRRARISNPPTFSSTRDDGATARGRARVSTSGTCPSRGGPRGKPSTSPISWTIGAQSGAAAQDHDEALERRENREPVRYHLGVNSRMWSEVVAVVIAAGAPMFAVQSPGQPPTARESARSRFPPGPGRDALVKVCADCHGPENVLGHLKTHDEWVRTLDEMAGNGAAGSDEEWNLIQNYLDRYCSLIFINKASAKDLAMTLDVSEAIAQAIVRARTEGGDFKTLADLKRVGGIDEAVLDARKDRLVFQ
jgi:competence ComEA-like helix-hairpin-helix protein